MGHMLTKWLSSSAVFADFWRCGREMIQRGWQVLGGITLLKKQLYQRMIVVVPKVQKYIFQRVALGVRVVLNNQGIKLF